MNVRIFLLLIVLISNPLFAQEEWDRKDFIESLREDVKDNDSRLHKRTGKQFLRYFEQASFDDTQEEYIYRLVRDLRKKRFNDAEDFYHLFRLFNHYGAGELNDGNLDVFLSSTTDYISNLKHKTAKSYVKNCALALVDSVMHQGKTFQWKISSGDFQFTYDSVPVITSELLQLSCASKYDTLSIHKTKGYLDLLNHKWYGIEGHCNWNKHKIPEDSIAIELSTYAIDLRKPSFEAENTTLKTSLAHNQDMLGGTYADGLSANADRSGAIYPSFLSYSDSIYVEHIFDEVDVEGSFEIRGKRIYFYGRGDRNIELTFYDDNEPFVSAYAKRFRMQDNRIFAENAQVNLAWGKDSITHPELNLTYTDSSGELSFERIKQNLGFSPIRSSYHQFDCYFDRMTWDKDSSTIFFSNDHDPSRNPALFESFDFYNEGRYQDVATMNKRHPAFMLSTLTKTNDGERMYYLTEIVDSFNYSAEEADQLMMNFAVLGFVEYDRSKQQIVVKDKLYQFLDRKLEQIDYDELRVVSRAEETPSGQLDLQTGDFAVSGVQMVELSDSNEVAVFPYDGDIIIEENRNFRFEGIAQTGQFGLYGKQMYFDYDSFELNFDDLDSLEYHVPSGFQNEEGADVYERVRTVLSDLTGTIYIDKPSNKSGLLDASEYPKLHSLDNSHIYYDNIKNGIYSRDLFSFEVNPFELDSLLTLETGTIQFPGRLNAPTIFPSFKDTMRLNDSYELAFSHDIPEDYPAYEGRGTFTKHLYLNNQGLKGDGTIYYLNSITVTDSIYFYPYQALAYASTHQIKEQDSPVNCPRVSVDDVSVDWSAFKDQMHTSNRGLFYNVFTELHEFDGSMTLSPKALTASGDLYYDEAISTSESFLLQNRDFTADNSKFHLFDDVGGEKLIYGEELYAAVNLDDEFGTFETLTDSSNFDLRKNNYHLYFELMEWDGYDDQMLFSQFSNRKGKLVSVGPYQDSLQFNATNASYDLTTYELDVSGVDEILSPPVRIEPDSSRVKILSDGKMERLMNASLSVNSNTITTYKFFDADVDLSSANRFKGDGTYDYIDSKGGVQQIYFSRIENELGSLKGLAYLNEEQNFRLNPYFGFKGKVHVNTLNDYLTFEGDARVYLTCNGLSRAWIPFYDEVDPLNVGIDLNRQAVLTDRQQWHSGLMISHRPTLCYPAFLSTPKRVNDYELIGVQGFVYYDEIDQTYIMGSEEKIEDPSVNGDYAVYNPEECTLYSEGNVNLGEHSGLLSVEAFGTLFTSIDSQLTSGIIDLSLDFLMHKKAAKVIHKELKKSGFGEKIDQSNSIHQRELENLVGARQLKKYNRKKQKGKRFIPDPLKHTFYFPQLEMEWNHRSASFISTGAIPLSNIIGRKIDRMLPGVVEYSPHEMGDEINIYIHISDEQYYFFKYRRGVMYLISSNTKFNKLITEAPIRMTRKRGVGKQDSYRYELGNLNQLQKFLKRARWE